MAEPIVKSWLELPETVEFGSGDWSFARGGYGLPDSTWLISYISEDGTETIYPLPNFISQMMSLQFEWGKEDVRRNVKWWLGI